MSSLSSMRRRRYLNKGGRFYCAVDPSRSEVGPPHRRKAAAVVGARWRHVVKHGRWEVRRYGSAKAFR